MHNKSGHTAEQRNRRVYISDMPCGSHAAEVKLLKQQNVKRACGNKFYTFALLATIFEQFHHHTYDSVAPKQTLNYSQCGIDDINSRQTVDIPYRRHQESKQNRDVDNNVAYFEIVVPNSNSANKKRQKPQRNVFIYIRKYSRNVKHK